MATKQDRIAELLAQGLPSSMVASLTGTSTSYISQLLSNPDYKGHVKALAAEAAEEESISPEATEHKSYKDKLKGARALLLDKLVGDMPMYTAGEALKAFDVVGKHLEAMEKTDLLRKGLAPTGQPGMVINGQIVHNVVHLHLPTAVVPDITYGPNKEILAIGGRTTATLEAGSLQKMLDEHMEGALSSTSRFGEAEDILYQPLQNR